MACAVWTWALAAALPGFVGAGAEDGFADARFCRHSSHTITSGAAMKIDEYVPDVIPISSARMP